MVATKGRPSLLATLASLIGQLEPGDEILVVRSGHQWGHQARNEAMPRSAGSHLLWIDDDDRYSDAALALIREQVEEQPDRVHLFAMAYSNDGRVVEPDWPLRIGAVGTPMICVPNVAGRVGCWSEKYQGDYDFACSTMELRGDTPVLHADVVALIGPS